MKTKRNRHLDRRENLKSHKYSYDLIISEVLNSGYMLLNKYKYSVYYSKTQNFCAVSNILGRRRTWSLTEPVSIGQMQWRPLKREYDRPLMAQISAGTSEPFFYLLTFPISCRQVSRERNLLCYRSSYNRVVYSVMKRRRLWVTFTTVFNNDSYFI